MIRGIINLAGMNGCTIFGKNERLPIIHQLNPSILHGTTCYHLHRIAAGNGETAISRNTINRHMRLGQG